MESEVRKRWPTRDIDFMGAAKWAIGGSLILVLLSIVSLFVPGPRLGTDFVGGTEVEIAFKKEIDAGTVRQAVEKKGFASPDVVQVRNPDNPWQYLIRVQEVSTLTEEQKAAVRHQLCLLPGEGEPALDAAACPEELQTEEVKFSPGGEKVSVRYVKSVCAAPQPNNPCPPRDDIVKQLAGGVGNLELRPGENNPVVQNPRENKVEFFFKGRGEQILDALRAELGDEVVPDTALRIEWISARAGKQLRDSAIKSVVLALIFIMLYVAVRFDIRFAPGGIAALAHDAFIAVGAMVVTQREITLATVAALLTIVGYSMNDTVVVYDRIRENLGKNRDMSFKKLINRSTSEMLGRTVMTQGTTALATVPFLIFGTQIIRDFAFALIVGVVVGTYSSIYIAAPLTEWLDRKVFGAGVNKKKRRVRRRKKEGVEEQPSPA
jgi:preprotein translocase subunit SecF